MKAELLLALLAVAVAAPATAQRSGQTEFETGSNIPVPRRARIADQPGASPAERGRLVMAEFARCVIDREPAKVRRIAAQPAATLDAKAIAAIATDECLNDGEMRFQPILLRGSLFTELARRRNVAVLRHAAWDMPVVPFDYQAGGSDGGGDDRKVQIGLLTFAQCVIARDAAAATAVVTAPTASKAQDAAFAALTPQFGPCLLAGQKITFSKPILEGALAEILYRGTVPTIRPASQEAK